MTARTFYRLPHATVQAVGLTTVPLYDIPPTQGALARRPIAAAVVRIVQDGDGRCTINVATVSALECLERPLPGLLDTLIAPDGLTVIRDADLDTLAMEAACRRTFDEERLAAMLDGHMETVDPVVLAGLQGQTGETALCRRLSLPYVPEARLTDSKPWQTGGLARIDRHAVATATSRLMLWSMIAAARSAEPGLFYEPMLALHRWLTSDNAAARPLASWARSRPMLRAVACEPDFRVAQQLRGLR